MARRAFNHAEDPEAQTDSAPGGTARTGGCFADGCPMPGSINTGGKHWHCPWHHEVLPTDIPRVTQILRDWECLTYEINIGRRILTGATACDPKAQNEAFRGAVERVLAATASGGWGDEFDAKGKDYRGWLSGLERFLAGRIARTLYPAGATA